MTSYNNKPLSDYTMDEIQNVVAQSKRHAGIIYKYTNMTNGKVYIGQTIHPADRHQTHISSSKINSHRKDSKLPFHCAIRKYGIDNFAYEVLEIVFERSCYDRKKLLDELEQHYISLYGSTNMKFGYNILNGGVSGERVGTHYLAKPVIQYDLLGNKIAEYDSIKVATEKSGCKNVHSSLFRGKHYANGYIWAHKSEGYPQEEFDKRNAKKIYQYTTKGDYIATFMSIKDAAKAVNGDKSRISLCANPPFINIAYGYRWANIKLDQLPLPPAKLFVQIFQYDKNGDYVAAYPSMNHAARAVGLKYATHIIRCLHDEWRKAGGYYWRTYQVEHINIYKNGKRINTTNQSKD